MLLNNTNEALGLLCARAMRTHTGLLAVNEKTKFSEDEPLIPVLTPTGTKSLRKQSFDTQKVTKAKYKTELSPHNQEYNFHVKYGYPSPGTGRNKLR